jgi:porphobilinogen synthase
MSFPIHRPRRLRQSAAWRDVVRETRLHPANLVLPFFVTEGTGVREKVESLPGVERLSVDELVREAKALPALGIRTVLLFGAGLPRDPVGTAASDPNTAVPKALAALRQEVPDLVLWADVCLCGATDHGHCGVVHEHVIDNDATLPRLCEVAVMLARAGAHAVAPSDMMDGRIGAIREALDDEGLTDTVIVSYAIKHASAFYGPFRDMMDSSPKFGDRKTYQMDPANRREAMHEAWLDIEEGADLMIVKPALPCLDLISDLRAESPVPVVAYQVSGEYAMIAAAAERGWVDGQRIMMESVIAMRRAGADLIITYAARELAKACGDAKG